MNKCNSPMCKLNAYDSSDKCILHCVKTNYQDDKHNIGFLELFYDELIKDILESQKILFKSDIKILGDYLSQGDYNKGGVEAEHFKKNVVNFSYIYFPERDNRDYFDYKRIMDRLGKIYFKQCEFAGNGLDLTDSKVFFDECTFHNRWTLFNHKTLESDRDVLYQKCIFKKSVHTVVADYKSPVLDSRFFSDCVFNAELILERVEFKSVLFEDTGEYKLYIRNIRIVGCKFHDKTILNNYDIGVIDCKSTEFNAKFEFKNNKVGTFNIDNTNFHRLVDCFKTEFDKCKIHKCIFDDFVGFEECVFGAQSVNENNNAEFIYATFMSFVNFRNAQFPSGLDLRRINHKESLNFLSISVSIKGSNRETFRIIKNSFDKVGNYIEANEYYIKEMELYKIELEIQKNRSGIFLLNLYKITSNYGQSYIRPVVSLIVLNAIYSLFMLCHESSSLYLLAPKTNKFLTSFIDDLNAFTKNIIPFTKVLRDGMEFISLMFYIMFTSLIWLVILAIKRSTKR